jgi:hypothetical protein
VSEHHTRPTLLSLAAFVLLAVLHTWPMAAAPAHWSRVEGDGALNIWAVGWVGRALTHAPSSLFIGNIFYPEKRTLAYSEAMLVQGAIGAPVMMFGGSAVLAYNLSLMAGFALTGWAFCLLVHRWTGSWAAGYVAGSLAAFNAFTLVQLTHLQFMHAEFFALTVFALDRVLTLRQVRHVVALAAGVVLQGLTSIYLLAFSIWLLAFACLTRLKPLIQGAIGRVAAAGLLSVVVLSPYLAQYVAVRQEMGLARAADEQEAASWANYLSTGSRVHFERWSREFVGDATSYTFPGIVAVALVALAGADRRNLADPRFRMCAISAAGCVAVSWLPRLPFYPALHSAIPLFQAVRVLAHIGQVVLLMVAILAGFGVASLQRALPRLRMWPALTAALLILVNAEALRAPLGLTWFEGVPAVYDTLAGERGAVVIEVPFPIPQQWFLNAPYMVNSTRHWRPLLNGYSGFRPPSYDKSYEAIQRVPSAESLIALSAIGVTHVVVHQRAMNHGAPDDRYDPYAEVASLRLLARDEDVLIYRLVGH